MTNCPKFQLPKPLATLCWPGRPRPSETLTFTVMLESTDPGLLGRLDSSHSMTGAFAGCKAGETGLGRGLRLLPPPSRHHRGAASGSHASLLLHEQGRPPPRGSAPRPTQTAAPLAPSPASALRSADSSGFRWSLNIPPDPLLEAPDPFLCAALISTWHPD